MSFNGRMISEGLWMKIFIVLICLALGNVLFADDMNQYLGDQLEENSEYLSPIEDTENSPFLYDKEIDKEYSSSESTKQTDSPFVGQDKKIETTNLDEGVSKEEELRDKGQRPLGAYESRPTLLETSYDEQFRKFHQAGKTAFNLNYYVDSYQYAGKENVFTNTFENSSKSFQFGYLVLGMDRFFHRGAVDWSWGINAGISFKRGHGIFVDGTESDMYFTLWAVPIDFQLGMGLPLGRYFRLTTSLGPSVMGLLQTRSDKKSAEKYKRRRQVSYGYFGSASLKFAVSELFRSGTYKMFSQYDVTKYFINFDLRYHNYQNFQDEIGVSGLSFGGGFTFEYM